MVNIECEITSILEIVLNSEVLSILDKWRGLEKNFYKAKSILFIRDGKLCIPIQKGTLEWEIIGFKREGIRDSQKDLKALKYGEKSSRYRLTQKSLILML